MNKFKSVFIYGGTVFTSFGFGVLITLIFSGYMSVANSTKPVFAYSDVANVDTGNITNEISGDPIRLLIPSLGYDLEVIPGYYYQDSKTWNLTTDKVQYATITPLPNNIEGNTFIYGHYRYEVFATLHNIEDGAEAIIRTSNGHAFYYKFSYQRVTNQYDNSIFGYTGKPILTLQTCEGLFYQNRQLFTFDFVRAI